MTIEYVRLRHRIYKQSYYFDGVTVAKIFHQVGGKESYDNRNFKHF